MTVKITLIGLGKIGASAGLALAKHTNQLTRTGHDIMPEMARRAQRLGALDKIAYNLPGSVADADIVLLALPLDQIRETLQHIAHDLKDGAVVLDTAPAKIAVSGWAKEFLPEKRYYVGLTPVINPKYLDLAETGTDAARDDMFADGLMGIVAPPGTASAAIKLATDLTTLLGAKPLYMDMVEVDSLLAATHLVPQLLAAGLVNATAGQPGWFEGRRVAGAAYAQVSAALAHGDPPGGLANALLTSREHALRVLDNILRELSLLREVLQGDERDELVRLLESAHTARADWYARRKSGDWDDAPQAGFDLPDTSEQKLRGWLHLGRKRGDPPSPISRVDR
jgi:prephenate dehydrogenase